MLEDGGRGADALSDLVEAHIKSSLTRTVQQVLPLLSDEAALPCLTHAIPRCSQGAALHLAAEQIQL